MVQLGGERHALDEEEGDEVWDRVEDAEVADAPVGPRVEEHSAVERVRGEGRVREEYLRTGVGGSAFATWRDLRWPSRRSVNAAHRRFNEIGEDVELLALVDLRIRGGEAREIVVGREVRREDHVRADGEYCEMRCRRLDHVELEKGARHCGRDQDGHAEPERGLEIKARVGRAEWSARERGRRGDWRRIRRRGSLFQRRRCGSIRCGSIRCGSTRLCH